MVDLQEHNTIFYAELLDLKHATDHATRLLHQKITILVYNQPSVQAAANPRSRNTTAREISKSLIMNKHIHISWIKTYVVYEGNEEADRLAKEAAESDRDPLSVKAPISFLKSINLKKRRRTGSQTGKIRGGQHLTSCQESRLIHATEKGKKS
ncbi:hypothetical protein AVEN_211229-1 [Araneus ventricosus]|uniref:Uncharacterized protein n=1 Tax=Araneus ventricosus TaxID=182803 RepID=A0A4Y2P5S4_ARAVE|nr:hypothetical protein AVEN_211229-1 [Araneus ventricosus]